jgi:hypothetical protein
MFSPSTPTSKPRKIEEVIAFGGISEKIAFVDSFKPEGEDAA